MSARRVRRTFASPFVITLAAAAIPAAACYVAPGPVPPRTNDHRTGAAEPGHDEDAPGHSNPPRPTTGDPAANMPAPVHGSTNAGAEQAPPATGGKVIVMENPPRPTAVQAPTTLPASKSERTWTVTRASGTCSAFMATSCPKPAPGQVAPTCNPPPPTSYACLPSMADGSKVTIVLAAGQTECQIKPEPMKCPANAICNPPPPQKVACPQ